ncbi:transcriptional regulator [Tenacibaculum holothuriorum]|uniref:Transcriptional regulator n=1 Tax=Tenacibaculum holothuriorum TaxID=1635173 RepID=A0A1Y2PD50_9FLAO|nr:response regulator [Tenacibaculum holothuriorum]OSY87669.1 transcriptional regulator [Tenacibaculum holothuriorum]
MQHLNILFIDDDEIERLKFNRICKQSDYKTTILEAENGEKALKILDKQLPQLIILDLNMPKMNGIEFLNILRKNERLKYIPIVILSSSNNKEDVKKCFEIGISGYLIKPLRYEDYKQTINKLLAYWSANNLLI